MSPNKNINKIQKPDRRPTVFKTRQCIAVTCLKRCTFGKKGEKAEFCKEHKSPDMINVLSLRCKEQGCNKQPSFAIEGEKAQFCKEHKSPDMIDVRSPRCEEPSCIKQPIFGMEGNDAKFCKDHKSPDMIDVKNRRCEEPGCNKNPSFGIEGEKAKFCKEHKSPDMIDVKSLRCKEPGCNKQPSFGTEGIYAQFCKEHKSPGMNDVRSLRCKEPGCSTRPSFGMEGDEAKFCREHKLPDMKNVLNLRCESEACAFYAYPDRAFAVYCIENKSLCKNCFSHLYPERTRLKVRKEQFILAEIERRIPELCEYKAIWDCALGNCVISKPDTYWFIGQIGIHLEIDEHGLNHEDDDHRVAEIHTASGMDGTFLIRFNPDEYLDEAGNEVSSCFRRLRLSTGDPRLEGTAEFGRRMDVLEEVLRQKLQQAEAGEVPSQENWKTQLFF